MCAPAEGAKEQRRRSLVACGETQQQQQPSGRLRSSLGADSAVVKVSVPPEADVTASKVRASRGSGGGVRGGGRLGSQQLDSVQDPNLLKCFCRD